MKPGDLVRIKSQYSQDQYGDLESWNLYCEPNDFKDYMKREITGTFHANQVGTVVGYSVGYDLVHRIERVDVRVLVGEHVGWIEDKILCKVGG